MASSGVIGTVGGDTADLLLLGDLRQQVWQHRAVALPTGGEFYCPDITGLRVHANMDLAPLPAARSPMLACLPFTVAAELDAGAINEQGHRAVRTAVRDLHRKPGRQSVE